MSHQRGALEAVGDDAREADGAREPPSTVVRLKEGALERAILTSASFSIIATDEKGVVQLFNRGAERMLGYRAFEVVDRLTPSDLHDPDEVRERAEALSLEMGTAIAPGFEALAFKASREIEDIHELTYVCKDGSRIPAIVSITALRGRDGQVIGYLLIGTDNSARKRAESLLKEAVAAAETANRAKSDFLSGMSHELRTPLNAILGFAQLIDTGAPPPTATQKRGVDQILKAGWYLLDLINEILDLALIESGKLTLSNEPVSLAEIIAECHAMIEPQAGSRGIGMASPRIDARQFIQADRTRLKQVLINLLFNAVKYNRPNGTVGIDAGTGSAGTTRISIRDTGMGLQAAQLGQLFQPFNRLGKQTEAEEGSGIGLVVSKRLVDLMGGSIGVESTPGEGSVFWVEFAQAQAPLASLATAGEAEPARAASPGAALRTVLYVEDNPANLELVSQLISRRGDLRLLSAPDAPLGIQYARAYLPEVILMDINLPGGMSGLEALEVLAADPATAHIPVIALSANAVPRDIERALVAGFFNYVTKPIVVGKFMLALDAALANPGGGRGLPLGESPC